MQDEIRKRHPILAEINKNNGFGILFIGVCREDHHWLLSHMSRSGFEADESRQAVFRLFGSWERLRERRINSVLSVKLFKYH